MCKKGLCIRETTGNKLQIFHLDFFFNTCNTTLDSLQLLNSSVFQLPIGLHSLSRTWSLDYPICLAIVSIMIQNILEIEFRGLPSNP